MSKNVVIWDTRSRRPEMDWLMAMLIRIGSSLRTAGRKQSLTVHQTGESTLQANAYHLRA